MVVMKQSCRFIALCSVLLVSILALGCGKKCQVVKITGSRTMGPVLGILAESYKTKHSTAIEIQEKGSLKGIASLLEGKCDIASCSVKMPAPQLFEAQKKGLVVKEYCIAYDIIIPIVNPANTIKNIFQGQLADMYSGLIKDWKDIEGKPGTVIVVDRDDSSGTRLFMNERFFESATIVEGSRKIKKDVDVVAYVSTNPTSVGYISARYMDKSVKALSVNSFSASLENIEKGYYPLYRGLYLYVNEKSYRGEVKAFVDFCTGKTGQDIIEKNGFIPVSRLNKPVR